MPDMSAIANPQQRQFNPYTENGGTILAVAGADSPERNQASIDATFRTDRAVLAVNGFAADGNMFVKKVKQRLEVYSVR